MGTQNHQEHGISGGVHETENPEGKKKNNMSTEQRQTVEMIETDNARNRAPPSWTTNSCCELSVILHQTLSVDRNYYKQTIATRLSLLLSGYEEVHFCNTSPTGEELDC